MLIPLFETHSKVCLMSDINNYHFRVWFIAEIGINNEVKYKLTEIEPSNRKGGGLTVAREDDIIDIATAKKILIQKIKEIPNSNPYTQKYTKKKRSDHKYRISLEEGFIENP